MKTVAFVGWLLMLSASVTIGEEEIIKTCQQNEDCSQGECCVQEECTAFLSLGQRCNILTQILSLQCPCEIGTSCITTKCHSISYSGKEVVEHRDFNHIETNTVDE